MVDNKKGLHNWRNLFKKPTLYEGVIFFMLIMILFLAWAYQRDIALCSEMIEDQENYFNYLANEFNENDFDEYQNFSLEDNPEFCFGKLESECK